MSRVLVDVHPEGDWWVIDVPRVGATQAADLFDVQPMVRDLIATVTGQPCDADVWMRLA